METFLGIGGAALAAWLLLLYLAHRDSLRPTSSRAGALNVAMLVLGLALSVSAGISPVVRLVLAFREVTTLAPERKATGLADRIDQAMRLVPIAALALPVGAVAIVVFLKNRRRQDPDTTPQ